VGSKVAEIWAVVPAAGMGKRMTAKVPKQYLPLSGKTLLEVSINTLLMTNLFTGILVALDEGDEYWDSLPLAREKNVIRVAGGATRSQSVTNALRYLSHSEQGKDKLDTTWVCVHDAARPCVSAQKIEELVAYCKANGRGAILGSAVADTVKRTVLDEDAPTINRIKKTENREQLWLAHTPQMFLLRELKAALDYCELDNLTVTDEASAIENVGGKVDIVSDRKDNIKVTLPEDLALAEYILHKRKESE